MVATRAQTNNQTNTSHLEDLADPHNPNMALPTGNNSGIEEENSSVGPEFYSLSSVKTKEEIDYEGESECEDDTELILLAMKMIKEQRALKKSKKLSELTKEGTKTEKMTMDNSGRKSIENLPKSIESSERTEAEKNPAQVFTPLHPNPMLLWSPPIELPRLDSVVELEHHIRQCEAILEEIGMMENEQLIASHKNRVMSQVRESLKACPEVYTIAQDNVSFAMNWREFRLALTNTFCTPVSLKAERDKQLRELQFTKPYAQFIHNCRKVYFLNLRLNSEKTGDLVEEVLKKLPRSIRQTIVTKLVSINPESWHSALPFYHASQNSLLAMLENVLHTSDIVDQLGNQGPKETSQPTTQSRPREFVNRIIEPKAGSGWLKTWVESFPRVLFCQGNDFINELMKFKQDEGDRIDVKIFSKGRRGPYGLVGIPKDVEFNLSCYKHDFVLRDPVEAAAISQSKNE